MNPDALQRAWVQQAQLDSEREIITCRMCKRPSALDEAITLWRNGLLVFAICDRCSGSHQVLLTPTNEGLEVRARSQIPLVIRSASCG